MNAYALYISLIRNIVIQDKLREDAVDLAELLTSKDAIIMVCGDAASMAKDVCRTIKDILVDQTGMEINQANEYIAKMSKENRYIEDIWT